MNMMGKVTGSGGSTGTIYTSVSSSKYYGIMTDTLVTKETSGTSSTAYSFTSSRLTNTTVVCATDTDMKFPIGQSPYMPSSTISSFGLLDSDGNALTGSKWMEGNVSDVGIVGMMKNALNDAGNNHTYNWTMQGYPIITNATQLVTQAMALTSTSPLTVSGTISKDTCTITSAPDISDVRCASATSGTLYLNFVPNSITFTLAN